MPIPLGYRVSILMDKSEEKIGSIFIPEKTRMLSDESSETGTILELGPLAYRGLANGESKEPWVKPGDRVYFKAYGGQKFSFESGRKIRIVNDEDIIALISEEDKNDKLL
ncbi:GroS Co-chaperonin GroES (HSP10) [uncultured Caudovirales phage]|uniref:GroS Co-chaperonin GroES (HSP10) n=1 Tax=uncultured Caudovirales phage TaxID=2100421 RepID=A0A6J5SG24_9CAUD|nr:GroS Co-chaperonin GroES (HSP10) [uncultured Caudovirales phage]CAB5228114.1 GroS Co-chaperonin GroES (HSP10) [uncultured Caudovirales phage]